MLEGVGYACRMKLTSLLSRYSYAPVVLSTTAIEYGEARSKVRQHKRTLPRARSLFELIDDQR